MSHADASALHQLYDEACTACQEGLLQQAAQKFGQLLELQPDWATAWAGLAQVARRLGRYEQATELLHNALELSPDHLPYLLDAGTCRLLAGRAAEAGEYFQRALAQSPEDPEALFGLGTVYKSRGQWKEAESHLRAALEHRPDFLEAWNNLGNLYREQGQTERALQCYDQALQLDSGFAPALNNRGVALLSLDENSAAIDCFRQALQLVPQDAETLNNLGNALLREGGFDEATQCLRHARRLSPNSSEIANNLGRALRSQSKYDEARDVMQVMAGLRSGEPYVDLIGTTICPFVFTSVDEMEDYRRRLMAGIAQRSQHRCTSTLAQLLGGACEPPFAMQFFSGNLRPIKQAYASLFDVATYEVSPPQSAHRVRIGMLVTDRHEGIFLRSMSGVLEHLDRARFRPVVICNARRHDDMRRGIQREDLELVSLPSRPERMIEAVQHAQLDILYHWEIGSDTTNYFLPFFRLAPVQCTSWGIQITSGIPQVDYYLSSALVEPDDAERHYSETLLCAKTLPSYQRRIERPTPSRSRDYFGLTSGQNVYVCAQHLGKFHPDFDPMLAAILRRDQDGVLVVVEDRHGFEAKRLRHRLALTMPDVASRVVFLPRLSRSDYLCLLDLADVALDAPHFSGVNTTYDSLALQTPIVTLPSPFHRGRFTYGCYTKMEMFDCVAEDPRHYTHIATRLGCDPDYRRSVSQRIGERNHVLYEDLEAVREHERLFEQMLAAARPVQVARGSIPAPHLPAVLAMLRGDVPA